jgi:hypothetical protein
MALQKNKKGLCNNHFDVLQQTGAMIQTMKTQIIFNYSGKIIKPLFQCFEE